MVGLGKWRLLRLQIWPSFWASVFKFQRGSLGGRDIANPNNMHKLIGNPSKLPNICINFVPPKKRVPFNDPWQNRITKLGLVTDTNLRVFQSTIVKLTCSRLKNVSLKNLIQLLFGPMFWGQSSRGELLGPWEGTTTMTPSKKTHIWSVVSTPLKNMLVKLEINLPPNFGVWKFPKNLWKTHHLDMKQSQPQGSVVSIYPVFIG